MQIGPAFPGRARNVGVTRVSTDWVAFVDAGCVADPGWLAGLIDALGAQPALPAVVYGNYEPALNTEWDVAQALVVVPPRCPLTGARPPSTASMLLHRNTWQAVGGFREDLRAAEDLLFFEAISALGVSQMVAPGATVYWSMAPGPGAFFRRLLRYSSAHLAAGLFRTWHRRVLMMDVALLATLLGSLVFWPFVALPVALGLVRLARTVSRRTANVTPRNPWRPDRLARVLWLLLLADLAVWGGLARLWVGEGDD